MWGRISDVFVLFAVAGLALPGSGQRKTCGTETTTDNQECVSLPYKAQYKTTRMATQTDGTTITRESTEVRAADSAGRWMTATTQPAQSGTQTPITHVVVADFVDRTKSSWEVPGKQATVTAMGPKCSTRRVRTDKPPAELLGTRTINGIEANGRRVTWSIAAGQAGNDAPSVRTSETWHAAAPGLWTLLVRAVYDSPRNKTTTELVNLTRTEPDPAMFRPPQGYEIVNKSAPPCPTGEVK
jgi:hypothetical protein